MKLTVTDVVLRQREVDVPAACPRCGAYLGDGKGLQLCYYEYTFYQSRSVGNFVEPVYEKVEPMGDELSPCLGAYCLACGDPVVEAHTKTLPSVVVEVPEKVSAWSEGLDRLVFGVSRPMTLEEAATALHTHLSATLPQFHSVGVGDNVLYVYLREAADVDATFEDFQIQAIIVGDVQPLAVESPGV